MWRDARASRGAGFVQELGPGEAERGTMTIDAFATPLDLAALAYFLLAIGTYRMVAGARALEGRSLIGAVQAQRVRWMLNMARRDNRMLDAILLGSLSQGNAFFASTSAIALGGLAAIILARRDFFSRSLRLIAGTDPPSRLSQRGLRPKLMVGQRTILVPLTKM